MRNKFCLLGTNLRRMVIDGKKSCATCKNNLSISDFSKDRKTKDGLKWQCKACDKIEAHARYIKIKPRLIVQMRRRHLKINYNMTPEEFASLLSSQGGGCALCGTTDSGANEFHVDHSHATGKVRGLLCGSCNKGLGLLQDSEELLFKAAVYVKYRGQ